MAESAEGQAALNILRQKAVSVLAWGRIGSPGAGSGISVRPPTVPDGEYTPMPLFMRFYPGQKRWGIDIPPIEGIGTNIAAILARLDVDLSTRGSELTLGGVRDLLDGSTPGKLGVNLREVAGTILTGRDWSTDLAKLPSIDNYMDDLLNAGTLLGKTNLHSIFGKVNDTRDMLGGSVLSVLKDGTGTLIDSIHNGHSSVLGDGSGNSLYSRLNSVIAANCLKNRLYDDTGAALISRTNPQPSREHGDYVRYTGYGVIDDSNAGTGWIAVELDTDGAPQYVESTDGLGTSVISGRTFTGTLRDYFEIIAWRIRQTGTLRAANMEPRAYLPNAAAFNAFERISTLVGIWGEDWLYHKDRPISFFKKAQFYIENPALVAGQNIGFEIEVILRNKN